MSEPETKMQVSATTVRVLDPDEWFTTVGGSIVTRIVCKGCVCDLYGSKPKKDGRPRAVPGWLGFAGMLNPIPDIVASTLDHHQARVDAAIALVEGL